MKVLFITLIILISGCTDSDVTDPFLAAEITGEKYTIFTASGGTYKVDDYHVRQSTGVISFAYDGSKYQANGWTVKTTKVED